MSQVKILLVCENGIHPGWYVWIISMTAKYKRNTPVLSFIRLTDEIDVTSGVKKYLQPYIDRKIFSGLSNGVCIFFF